MKKITFLCLAMFALCWQSNAQDTCGTATAVTPGTITGTTITQDTGGADMTLTGATDGTDAAWFVYTATGDGTIDVSACGSGVDTDLGVGTGACGALTDVIVQDDTAGCTSFSSEILGYAVVTGGTYYIEWSDEWNAGPFDWSLTFTPAPLCTAAVIDSVTAVDDCANSQFSLDIVVSDAGDAGSVFDDGTNTYPVVVGTVTVGPYADGDSVTIELTAVDPACSATGTFSFTCPAPQDMCATAEAVTEGTITGTTINQDTAGGQGDTVTTRDSAWFAYTATGDGTINVNSCGGGADTRLYIFDACGGTAIANDDDSCDLGTGSNFASEVDGLPVTAGTTYYIEWDDRWSASPFDWSITFTPAPLCDPAAFDAGTIDDSGCNPDGTGTFTVDIVVEEVGDGGTFEDGTNSYPVVAGTVTAGPYNTGDSVTIEYVNGDPACDSTVGTFTFDCPLPPPANDEVAGAIDLPVGDTMCDDAVLATNVSATTSVENVNTADCTFAGGAPAGDVWYKVTVPVTGEVTVETSTTGEVTDTVMTMYRGTSGNLVEVGCDDDGGEGTFSLIALTSADGISPGDVLLVRVWEYGDNNKGTFNVCAWSPSTLGIDDNSLAQFSYYPNPVNNTLTLNAQNTIDDVTLYNMLGQVVLRATPNAVNTDVDMSALSNGAYFVQVTIANITKTVRVIKQ